MMIGIPRDRLGGEENRARAAGGAAARGLREQVRPNLLFGASAEAVTTGGPDLRTLKAMASLREIRDIRLNSTLISDASLTPLLTGGFRVDIAARSWTPRARFSLAHEIGHTFFYDLSRRPPERKGAARQAAYRNANLSHTAEEAFCDEFAMTLLAPAKDTEEGFATFLGLSAADFIGETERFARENGLSILSFIARLNRLGVLPRNLFIVVLRKRPHYKTGEDVTLRVHSSYPAPSDAWFLPTNQRAISAGLQKGLTLVSAWEDFSVRDRPGVTRRSGTLSFGSGSDGDRLGVLENSVDAPRAVHEVVRLWRRTTSNRKWRRVDLSAPVRYRLYASGVADFYCLAVVDLSTTSEA